MKSSGGGRWGIGPLAGFACRFAPTLRDRRNIPIAVIVSYDGDEALNDGDHVRS
jgi:hypothetical protein